MTLPGLTSAGTEAKKKPLVGGFQIPSGKHTENYGNTPFLMGKSTINGHFP
jgi:hypothetical protein